MDFEFSEEQDSIRELAREILESEASIDRVKEMEATPDWFDEGLWRKLAEANLLGIAIDEEHGGMGFGFGELCVLLEEVGRCVAPIPAFANLVLGALPIAEFGSEIQKKEWLPRIASGGTILTAALADSASSDLAAPGTRAEAAGGGFSLSGVKKSVPFARRAEAILVSANADGGPSLFLVPANADGLVLTERVTSTGEPLFDVELRAVAVGADAKLPGGGTAALTWIEQRALVALAAIQVGVSDRALEITAGYTKEREQFGVPIGSFQAVQHRCADGFIDLDAMRWTTWRAAWRLSEGLPAEREARVAKFWAADAGSRIANSGLHLHGGLGSDVDYPIHRYFLWSKALELCLGAAGPQLVRLGRDMAQTGAQEL